MIDPVPFMESIEETKEELERLDNELFKARGFPFKITPTELRKFLFEERGLMPVEYTEKEKIPSMSSSALEYLTDPVVETIINRASTQSTLSGLKSLVGKGEETSEKLWKFHPEFRPISESTSGGRIYTKNPSVNQWNWMTEVRWFRLRESGSTTETL